MQIDIKGKTWSGELLRDKSADRVIDEEQMKI